MGFNPNGSSKKEKASDCLVCGESGHSAKECSTRKSMQSDVQYYRCKGYGHIVYGQVETCKVCSNKLSVEGERGDCGIEPGGNLQ